MKNKNLVISILVLIAMIFVFVASLIGYILSIEAYDGGFDANTDYIVYMFSSLILLGYMIYHLYNTIKKINENKTILPIVIAFTSALIGFYFIGCTFKAIAKNNFTFKEYYEQIFIGIAYLILMIASIFKYFNTKKDN